MAARVKRRELLYDGCYVHVISRSIRKIEIFKDSEDFELFYNLLMYVKRQGSFSVYHYCFMHTHFHMVVSVNHTQGLSKAIQYLKSRYAYYFHEKYKVSGPIWRERFRSVLIEDENYMRACGEYIERNPLKAGMVENAEDWKYSSSGYYCNGKKDELVDGYGKLGKENRTVDVYLEEEFFENGKAIGSPYFLFQIKEKMKSA